MANEASSSTSDKTTSGDSYIGSFISVTSKCEIRYEGVLYFLNTQDSTFGLKDVRSFGTEGRQKDGQQVPPSDKVYEYILFRGSDIRDLRVLSSAPAQNEEPIFNDPAIIQSNSYVGPSNSVSTAAGSSTEYNLYTETSELNARAYPSLSPSQHAGTQNRIWDSSQSTHNAVSSYGMPTGPTQWQGYSAQQHSVSSNKVSPGHLHANSSSIYLTATPTLTSDQLFTPFTDSKQSFPFHHSTLINSNGLAMPFSLTYQNASNIQAQVVNKVAPDPSSLLPVQSLPNSVPSFPHPRSDPQQQQLFSTPNLSQSKLCEPSPAKTLYPDQKDIGVMSSISLNFSSSAATPAVQPPLLPLPPPSQKLQPLQFTDDFDFQAMNEKFKKDEVWGYLGKANQREKVEGMQENGSTLDSGDDNSDLSKTDAKPAYNKDDFFDSISCNSIGRGSRNGQNRFSGRMKADSETFGNFQRRPQFGYGGHRGGRGDYHGQYNSERGHRYGNRGRGGYILR